MYSSKFRIGDEVSTIMRSLVQRAQECRTCKGSKTITIEGDNFYCPRCKGSGSDSASEHKWHVSVRGKVGKVQIEHYCDTYMARYEEEGAPNPYVRYMLSATGIGSGQVWDERDLFATDTEALAECTRRNADPYGWEYET